VQLLPAWCLLPGRPKGAHVLLTLHAPPLTCPSCPLQALCLLYGTHTQRPAHELRTTHGEWLGAAVPHVCAAMGQTGQGGAVAYIPTAPHPPPHPLTHLPTRLLLSHWPQVFLLIVYFMAGLRANAAAFFGLWGVCLLTILVAQVRRGWVPASEVGRVSWGWIMALLLRLAWALACHAGGAPSAPFPCCQGDRDVLHEQAHC